MSEPDAPAVVYVLGPTGTGKTAVSLLIAKHMSAEVLNADAMQTYRGFDIGTAKITVQEMAGVVHHGFDLIDPTSTAGAFPDCMTLHAFLGFAVPKISALLAAGKSVVVVGGSNMYLTGLIWEAESAPVSPTANNCEFLELIHANDVRRRANAETAGRVQRGALRFANSRFLVLETSDAAWMRSRLERRVDAMFQAGLAEEARRALEIFPPGKGVLQAIGYREFAETSDVEETRRLIKANTWRYFRRQEQWLRNSLVPQFPLQPVKLLVGPALTVDAALAASLVLQLRASEAKPTAPRPDKKIFRCERCHLSFPGTVHDWNTHLNSKLHRKRKRPAAAAAAAAAADVFSG